jgi:hypothetical protein
VEKALAKTLAKWREEASSGCGSPKKKEQGKDTHGAWQALDRGRRERHLQPQPCLIERADKSGGKEEIERDVIQGLATPDSMMDDGN